MATCNGCGAQDVTRTKTILTDNQGTLLEEPIEFCVQCKPDEFDRWQDPSNKHGGFRWQYEPEKYKKRYKEDGSVYYEAKDERNQDLEDKIAKGDLDEQAKYQRALEKRRRENAGKRKALTPAEIESAVNTFRPRFEKVDLEKKWLQ